MNVGRMANRVKRSSVSMAFVPRSIKRERPPVWRSRWKRNDN